MEIKSTLKVFNEADIVGATGVVGRGQLLKQLAGSAEHPSERLTVALVSFEPGTHEHLHWHLIEVFYYVISGRAVMKDIEGKARDIGPGSVVYASPGIAGSHSWEIKERLQLIAVRATADPEKTIQFDVDPATQESTMPVERLAKRQAISFKKSLY
ncbi:MAG: cupin domain-containing protein [Betaproteobacteria bacterium]|nr:cupin domain-containing protein [Betaproteobacteria bacterium]MBI2292460.1 cupin domain-containing protein [Betaproteobacteria bacterium]MBI3052446.1 cupin domain-containing protein [Betaproteobacteria bacterium]